MFLLLFQIQLFPLKICYSNPQFLYLMKTLDLKIKLLPVISCITTWVLNAIVGTTIIF